MMSVIESVSPCCEAVPRSMSLANSQISQAAANAIGVSSTTVSENQRGSGAPVCSSA